MELLLRLLGDSSIIGATQMLVAKMLKDKPNFARAYITVVTFLIGVVGFTVSPAAANAAATLNIPEVLNVVAMSLLQTQQVVGTHSMFKNTVLPLLKNLLFLAVGKIK